MPYKSEFPPVPIADEPFPPRLLSTIWQHFSADPGKVALINAKQPQTDFVTYGELYVFSLATAAFLRHRGFGPGDIACLALPNCWEYAPIFLGVGLQGGAISGANPLFTEKEFQRQFSDCNCRLVVCVSQNLQKIITAIRNLPLVETIILVEIGQSKKAAATSKILHQNDHQLPLGIVPFANVLQTEPIFAGDSPLKYCRPDKDLLVLPYSSGTTGTPKGVMINHRCFGTMQSILLRHYREHINPKMRPPYEEANEHDLLLLPFFHCYGFGMLVNSLLKGAIGVVMARFEPTLFCETVQNFKVRLLKIVPPILVFLAKSPMVSNYDFSHLHVIITGAAPVGADICDGLKRRFPQLQSVAQGFGMTEMTVATHLAMLDNKQKPDAAGKLVANLEMKIVDVISGKETEQGMPGEMHFRGPTVMLGYLGRPRETAEAIDADGWLRTGDIAYVDKDGFIHVVDRQKELIKVNGLQVSPSELEDLLLSHPDIQDCGVVGVPDERAGEVPRAFVVRREGSNLSGEKVQQFVKAKAVYYKQLRGGVEFVDTIPKSAAGKILRRLLKDSRQNKKSTEEEEANNIRRKTFGQLSKL